MRLINADKLMLSLSDWKLQEAPISTYPKPKEFTADDMQRMIWRTIRDCESVVEEQPTVQAIPIEWIEEWGWKNGMSESMSLRVMIDDWEKENEHKESD